MLRAEPEGRSVGQLLRDLADDVTRLIRDELALARSEASDNLNRMVAAVISILGGALLGLAALMVLLDAVVMGLSNHMPDWMAAVIVGGVVALVGFILVRKGQSELSAHSLAPRRTAESVRKDIHLVKEQVS
ncbi:MAG TPA: phage holin family protein [Geminicoccaceae bacterium]|nr:phage holin family protein [Geminicoccus sp.]HMU53148.1 phage holin family protein [Geminicoccaceae bacterium]